MRDSRMRLLDMLEVIERDLPGLKAALQARSMRSQVRNGQWHSGQFDHVSQSGEKRLSSRLGLRFCRFTRHLTTTKRMEVRNAA